MHLLNRIIKRAQSNPQRIVLPESTEIRILKAADIVLKDKIARIILIGDKQEILSLAKKENLNHIAHASFINPETDDIQKYIQLLYDLRKSKGMTMEEAEKLAKDPLYLACLMIKQGDADGELAGAQNTTGNVLRPAFQIIRTKPGISIVSGAFLMFTPTPQYGEEGLFVFADCAVNPNPSASELAEIALSSAETAQALAGVQPKVAMLSFQPRAKLTNWSIKLQRL